MESERGRAREETLLRDADVIRLKRKLALQEERDELLRKLKAIQDLRAERRKGRRGK